MCSGLAWLLNPDGWHGLGSAVLNGLLAKIGVHAAGSASATVALEETRHDTRAGHRHPVRRNDGLDRGKDLGLGTAAAM